jgi:multiple antibiotic resistance protein
VVAVLRDFLHAFVPLFVAVDVVGVVPLYLALTQRLAPRERQTVLRSSLVVAAVVSVGFVLLGKALFLFLGITVADFKIAGGLILVVLATRDLLTGAPVALAEDRDVGVVPLGVPIIVGPAVMTSTLVVVDLYGAPLTILALLANLAVCWLVLAHAQAIERVVGSTGARAVSKLVGLLLAAIGVQFIRQGLNELAVL